jgi:hypothetical protein
MPLMQAWLDPTLNLNMGCELRSGGNPYACDYDTVQ